MSNLAANPAGMPSLCLCARLRQRHRRRHQPLSVTATPIPERQWQSVKPQPAWRVAAESETRIDFAQHCLAARFPASALAPLQVLSGAQRHSVFCFVFHAPAGLRLSQNKLVSRDIEHRTSFSRAPPQKQPFGTWEPGPFA